MLRGMVLLGCLALGVDAATQPLIDYVTYLGGSYARHRGWDRGGFHRRRLCCRDTVIAGFSSHVHQPGYALSTSNCAFVTKFNPSGTAIDFSVCLANSQATAFALDANGNIYLGIRLIRLSV